LYLHSNCTNRAIRRLIGAPMAEPDERWPQIARLKPSSTPVERVGHSRVHLRERIDLVYGATQERTQEKPERHSSASRTG
jgi:hypothetical protein